MRNGVISGYNAKINLRGIFWRTSNSMKFTLHPWGIKLRPSVGLGGLCQICFSLPGQVAAPQQVADLLQSCLANGQSSHNVCTLSTWRRSRPCHCLEPWFIGGGGRFQLIPGHSPLFQSCSTTCCQLWKLEMAAFSVTSGGFIASGKSKRGISDLKKMKPAAKHSFAKQTPCAAWEFLRGPWTSSNAGGRGCFVETALRQAITP